MKYSKKGLLTTNLRIAPKDYEFYSIAARAEVTKVTEINREDRPSVTRECNYKYVECHVATSFKLKEKKTIEDCSGHTESTLRQAVKGPTFNSGFSVMECYICVT